MEVDEFREKLLEASGIGEATKTKIAEIDSLVDTFSNTLRKLKKLELKFETVIEVTSQINSKSLNLALIENFTLNTVMGYFACPKLFLMRQDNYDTNKIILALAKNMDEPNFSFKCSGEFAKKLCSIARPIILADYVGEFGDVEEVARLEEFGVKYIVPLLKMEENIDDTLQGILCMGKKFRGESFSAEEIEFLDLLGSMVAISLHNAQLYHRSIYDGLTQVYSWGHFNVHLALEIDRAKRYSTVKELKDLDKQVSLIMLDIDDFKKFNDTYGHQAGNALLKSLAKTVHDNCRSSDLVARYGGEEFAIVLPETGRDKAVMTADRVLRKVAENSVDWDGKKLKVTVSIGTATFPTDCRNMTELIRSADEALYKSKADGKNRVTVAEPLDYD